MSNLNATSPMVEIDFSQLGTKPEDLSIVEHAFLGHVNIRGSLDNENFTQTTEKVLGAPLPVEANTFVEVGDYTILWLGPNEWLVVTTSDRALGLIDELEASLGDTFSAVNDVSGGNTVLEISGDKAQAVLLKGCPLDLHQSVFSTGQCAQTVIAKTGMTLWQVDDAPIYKLIVRRSFSDYLGLWLIDAAGEYRS